MAGLLALLGSSISSQTPSHFGRRRPGWPLLRDGLDDVTWMCHWEKSRPSRGSFLQATPLIILCNPECHGVSLLETSKTPKGNKSSCFSEGGQGASTGARAPPHCQAILPVSVDCQLDWVQGTPTERGFKGERTVPLLGCPRVDSVAEPGPGGSWVPGELPLKVRHDPVGSRC